MNVVYFILRCIAAFILFLIAVVLYILADFSLFLGGVARLIAYLAPPWDDDEPDDPACV